MCSIFLKLIFGERDSITSRFSIILFLLFMGAVFSHCSVEQAYSSDYPVKAIPFSISKEICLPLDSFSAPAISYFQIVRGDTLKFLFYNAFNRSLYTYDFRRAQLITKTTLQTESGELPAISAFYYLNRDSILLFPEYGRYYYWCNEKGRVYPGKISFVDEDDTDKIESHWISSSAPLAKFGNTIYINNVFGWIAREGDPDKFLLIEHNIQTRSSGFFIQHPPSIYEKNFENTTFRHLNFTVKEPEQTILYSFNFDPYVYEFTGDKKNIKRNYCAPDGYVLPDKLQKNISGEEAWIRFQTSFSFSKMTYDPFKKVLTRVGLLPYHLDDIKTGNVNPESPKKPKIYVFDASYQLLGELALDKAVNYYFINIFATEEGLWIQKLTNNEDYLCFELMDYEVE